MSNNNNKNTRRHEAIVLGSGGEKNLNIEFYIQPNYQSSMWTILSDMQELRKTTHPI